MVNETQSFAQYKDRAHSIGTDVISRIIGSENYQQKLVPGWVDSIGQEIVNKLRVCIISPQSVNRFLFVGTVIRVQIHCISDYSGEERRTCAIINVLLGCSCRLSCDSEMGKSSSPQRCGDLRSGPVEKRQVFILHPELYQIIDCVLLSDTVYMH